MHVRIKKKKNYKLKIHWWSKKKKKKGYLLSEPFGALYHTVTQRQRIAVSHNPIKPGFKISTQKD